MFGVARSKRLRDLLNFFLETLLCELLGKYQVENSQRTNAYLRACSKRVLKRRAVSREHPEL